MNKIDKQELYIKMNELINESFEIFKDNGQNNFYYIKGIVDLINSIEKEKPPHIIHCKDCKYIDAWVDTDATRTYQCKIIFDEMGYGADVELDHFCGYAKKR